MSLISELKRRNVFRVAMLYVIAAWVLLQVGDVLFDALGVPTWALKLLLGLEVLGLPLALVFSWVYELTPEGLKREHEVERRTSITQTTGRRIDVVIAALLVVAIGLLVLPVRRDFRQLGRPDDAFRSLETARRMHDPGLSAVLTDPLVDPLRGDPRFDRLLSDLGVKDLREH